MRGVLVSEQPLFLYADPTRPLARSSLLGWQPPHDRRNMTVEEFLAPPEQRPAQQRYRYYSQRLDRLPGQLGARPPMAPRLPAGD